MKIKELLDFIPKKELEFIAAETKVDHQVKKLDGIIMFQLLLFSMLNHQRASLRVLENFFHSVSFKALAGIPLEKTTKYNSIRDRVITMNPEFFEKIFFTLFDKFNIYFNENNSIQRYDSTMVAVTSRLVEWGMKVGSKTNKKQIKYTMGMKGSFPCHVEVFTDQKSLSEDITIPKAILNFRGHNTGIVVFDRGVRKRATYTSFNENDIRFVSRANLDVQYKLISSNIVPNSKNKYSVKVTDDLIVQLRDKYKLIETNFRLIKAIIKATGEKIYFITNVNDLSCYEIATIYKQRWEIEVFFKFLKQELNLNHFISRNLNAVKVMIYMTLILSILVIAYKKSNKIAGYKIAKLKIANELESELIKEIVILCGGNPYKFFNNNSDP